MRNLHRFITATFLVTVALAALTGCSHDIAGSAVPASSADITKLDDAIRSSDIHTAEHFMTVEPNLVNVKDDSGKTPLTLATEMGDSAMIDMVKKYGGHE